jgi:uncharacterized protein YbaR (Trm112 family)
MQNGLLEGFNLPFDILRSPVGLGKLRLGEKALRDKFISRYQFFPNVTGILVSDTEDLLFPIIDDIPCLLKEAAFSMESLTPLFGGNIPSDIGQTYNKPTYFRTPYKIEGEIYALYSTLKDKNESATILDCGAGEGRLLEVFLKNCENIYGIEYERAACAEFYRKTNVPRIFQADGCQLPYRNNSFDFVFL